MISSSYFDVNNCLVFDQFSFVFVGKLLFASLPTQSTVNYIELVSSTTTLFSYILLNSNYKIIFIEADNTGNEIIYNSYSSPTKVLP